MTCDTVAFVRISAPKPRAALAIASLGVWLVQFARSVASGRRAGAHTLYLASHLLVFAVGYLWIDDINHGWLVLNVWHNAQYILFVWMYNTNRYGAGAEPRARFLSTISQKSNWLMYLLVCLGLSSVLYFGLDTVLARLYHDNPLPIFLMCYMTINFHHYVVDGTIWKLRRKPVREALQLDRP